MQEPVAAAKGAGIAEASLQWGRGVHPAALNFGGCFAHEAASERACPLLYAGSDSVRIENRWRGPYGLRHTTS
jgi:ribonuclease VapC